MEAKEVFSDLVRSSLGAMILKLAVDFHHKKLFSFTLFLFVLLVVYHEQVKAALINILIFRMDVITTCM